MKVEVALVNDIVVVGALKESVVAVSLIIEVENMTYAVAGVGGGSNKVAARLTKNHIAFNNFLHALEYAKIGVDRVSRIFLDIAFQIGREHI